jgi:L-cystine transport system permease protein
MNFNLDFMMATFWVALTGLGVTLKLTFIPLLLATPIAFAFAIIRLKKIKGFYQIITFYISLLRGTPIVLQILLFYSLLPSVLNAFFESLQIQLDIFSLNPIIYAYIIFTLNSVATLSEVFRSALLTVQNGQLEAAKTVGLTSLQAYVRIVIPQALVSAFPNISNTTVNLLKGTSLAFLMTVKEITALAKLEAAYGYNYIEAYLTIFVIYVLLATVIQLLFGFLEKRFGRYKYPLNKRKGEFVCLK